MSQFGIPSLIFTGVFQRFFRDFSTYSFKHCSWDSFRDFFIDFSWNSFRDFSRDYFQDCCRRISFDIRSSRSSFSYSFEGFCTVSIASLIPPEILIQVKSDITLFNRLPLGLCKIKKNNHIELKRLYRNWIICLWVIGHEFYYHNSRKF